MADIDTLPKRGIPALALVDSTGIATNGSQTLAQLAAKGMRAVCAVDGSGISQGGATVAVLAQRGIRAFCPVDELGVAADASTADILRRRGIRPMVLLNASGVALTGSATMDTLSRRGLQAFCPVDEAGNATTMGPVILITNTTVLDNITIGSNVGVMSVAGGSGTYTFSLTSNPGSLFATAGTNGVNLNTAAALTVGDKPITVRAAGGVPTPIDRSLVITVAQSPTLPANAGGANLPVISGTTTVGSVLTTTDGTWTGFPAPYFTYQWQREVPSAGDPDVVAWRDAVVTAGGTVSPGREAAVTTFVTALKSAGVWATMDRYWLFAGENLPSAKVDMVTRTLWTTTGTPAFVANKGVVTSIGNNIDTGFVPSATAGHKYALNSATVGCFVNTSRGAAGTNAFSFGTADAAFTTMTGLNPFGVGSYAEVRLNDLTYAGNDHNHTSRGHWVITRNASGARANYYNGSSAGYPNGGYTGTVAAVALPDQSFYIGNLHYTGDFYSAEQTSSFVIASGWNSTQVTDFYNAEVALLTAIAVLP